MEAEEFEGTKNKHYSASLKKGEMNLVLLVTFYLAISFGTAENFHPPAADYYLD